MAVSNRERVERTLDLLKAGLLPFVVREMKAVEGFEWWPPVRDQLCDKRPSLNRHTLKPLDLDVQALFEIMWEKWNSVFSRPLGQAERNLVAELRGVRNAWAHQEPFSGDDTYRALDSAQRLLTAISAPEAEAIGESKYELLRTQYAEQARNVSRKKGAGSLEGQPTGGLRPWREIVVPHPDVASGRFTQAEFAADLAQVFKDKGADEYRVPAEFFRRTYLTEGLSDLLRNALRRLSGQGGDPVVELQTNFGGGKTHSMLALYHLTAGGDAGALPGVEPLLREVGLATAPTANRAVLVGTALTPGQPVVHPDGVRTHTLWGELAYQLGGAEGYALVAAPDQAGVSPGSDLLRDLFDLHAPVLVLIDEWLAFVRQLYGKTDMPAGSFDANLTFAQALTEAARQSPRTLLVASIPQSQIEIGGEGGVLALDQLRNTFGRLQTPWRPATTEEGFEIVRRRLFLPITDPALFPQRDAVVRAFADLYRTGGGEFPAGCREADYERRLALTYPIHPELLDRLFTEWSALDKFQRTRGVLRLMASVIHTLWAREDRTLLILPASLPLDDGDVQKEVSRYLEDPWVPVIERDIDGPQALPLRLDGENPNFGRYAAARRVARTVYLGSAPTLRSANRGIDDRSVKLGCAQPGESVATFGDALRRLTDEATHLYVDNGKYWFSTQPSVTRLAQERADRVPADAVEEEIRKLLREQEAAKGDFTRITVAPRTGADVADDPDARLVILGPDAHHAAKLADSQARRTAQNLLDSRGSGPRVCRNALVFLAPDRVRLAELQTAVRQEIAWKSIKDESTQLNLDPFQDGQATSKLAAATTTVRQRIPETYLWVLYPVQEDPLGPVTWEERRLGADQSPVAPRVSRKLREDGALTTAWAGTMLRLELDKIPLWREDGERVALRQLEHDFAAFVYLPRLRTPAVLRAAVEDGVGQLLWATETFALADGWDAAKGRYRGLRAGEQLSLDRIQTAETLLVHPDAAQRQLAAERTPTTPPAPGPWATTTTPETGSVSGGTLPPYVVTKTPGPDVPPSPAAPTRFYGAVRLSPGKMATLAGEVAQAIVQHLAVQDGAEVVVTLEIEASLPQGASEQLVRTVMENSRTLKFSASDFERG